MTYSSETEMEMENIDLEECSIPGKPTSKPKSSNTKKKCQIGLWVGVAVLVAVLVLALGVGLGLSLRRKDDERATSTTSSEAVNIDTPAPSTLLPTFPPTRAPVTSQPVAGDIPTPSGTPPFISVGCFRNETSLDQHSIQSQSAGAKAWECSQKCLTFYFGVSNDKTCHCFVQSPSQRLAIGSCNSVSDGTPIDQRMEVYFNKDASETCSQPRTETVRNFLTEEDDAPFGFDIVENTFRSSPFELFNDECGTNIYEVQTEVSEGSQSLQTSMETVKSFARERRSERSNSLKTSASVEAKSFLFSASASVSASFDSEQTNLFKTSGANEAESRVFTSTGVKRLAEVKIVDFDNTYRFVTFSRSFGNLLRVYLSSGFSKDKAYEMIQQYGQFVLTRGIFGGYMELRTTMRGSDVSRLFESEAQAKACYEASVSAKASGFGFKGSASVSASGCSDEASKSLEQSKEAYQSEVSEQTVVGGRKACASCEEFVVEAQDATLLTTKDKYPVGDQGVQFRLLSDFLAADKVSPLEVKRLQITETQFDQIQSHLQAHILEYLADVSDLLGGCDCSEEALPFLKEDDQGNQICSCYDPDSEPVVPDGPGVACDLLEEDSEVVLDESIDCPAPTVNNNPVTLEVQGALQTGKECLLSVQELALAIGNRDWITEGIDLEAAVDIKTGQGTVLRARNERTGREGALLIWSDGIDDIAYGAWNPREYSGSPDWAAGDTVTLLDLERPGDTELAGVSCYRTLGDTGWNLGADHIRFGKSGLVGGWWKEMTIEYDLKEERGEIVTGVWSDSDLPYSVQYYDARRSAWVTMYKNCRGTVTNLATARAKRWRLDWESTDLHSTSLSTYRSGGGFHAELLV